MPMLMMLCSSFSYSNTRGVTPKSKRESQEKETEKIFNDTHPQYPPPQKKWRPKAIEEKQMATKIENKTTLVQHPAGMVDNLANKAGQSAPGADRPTP
jgi:hypothetical protein